jgi:hypothetical protein
LVTGLKIMPTVFDNVPTLILRFGIVKGRKDTDIRYDVEKV